MKNTGCQALMLAFAATLGSSPVIADEAGIGRDNDIPDSQPGNEAIDAQGVDGFWQVLAELFCLGDEDQP